MPRVHRVRRRLTDGRVSIHWYHRPTKIKLPSPDSPDFQAAYAAAEQQWVAQKAAAPAAAHPELNEQATNRPQESAQPSPAARSPAPKFVTQKFASQLKDGPRTPAELASKMQRRRAGVTQAEIARVIRAAKQAGATQVELRLSDSASAIVRLQPDNSIAPDEEIVL